MKYLSRTLSIILFIFPNTPLSSQTNLLLNGGFEEINTCTEYKAECGVEAWFYLKDVKAQMMLNETNTGLLGANSFAIYYNWLGYTDFVPLIGTILPCALQKGNSYIFKGIISAKLNPKLILQPGLCTGKYFYVPKRSFSKDLKPDSIVSLRRIPNTPFHEFEYHFTATGDETYLAFGTFIREDTVGAKKKLIGTQTVSIILDKFSLTPADPRETVCAAFAGNKETIYEYNYRHKEMDYSLYGKGLLPIEFENREKDFITRIQEPIPPPKPDTLKLGDVLFDFNKAALKPNAKEILHDFFVKNKNAGPIDSIYVEGHTDSVGSDARNLQLSMERCETIRDWLLENNISLEKNIKVHPFGRTKPVATNKTAQGRAMNRRVELVIFRNGM